MILDTWILEPHDSLLVRDGKPFGAGITQSVSLDFPFPSTTTGGVRTRAGLDRNDFFDTSKIPIVKDIEVRGGLLVSLKPVDGQIAQYFLPSPADALLTQNVNQQIDGQADVVRLAPLEIGEGATNLPAGLMPVGILQVNTKVKPFNDLKFWTWEHLKRWLSEEKSLIADQNLNNYGIGNLPKDSRVHVGINENFASIEGGLFQTRGLEFNYGQGKLSDVRKFGLTIFVDEANSRKLLKQENLAPLGGERRLIRWRKSQASKIDLRYHIPQNCPDEIKKHIISKKRCRLMLLTPAYFDDIFAHRKIAGGEVKAVACHRYQTVSGWDFAFSKTRNGKTVDGQPKPTRRLLPAGTVLFLEITVDDVNEWVEKTWFNCLGDDRESNRAGFGLCVLGVWNEEPLKIWS